MRNPETERGPRRILPSLTSIAMSGAQSLRRQDLLYGFWCATGHTAVIDAAASVGPDFVVIDTQHGIDLGQVDPSVFAVLASYEVASLVRVESIDPGPIGRALDLGADGIIVPLVETADEAERAVKATRHAPEGWRSYGMHTRRVGAFDQRPFVAIQIETEPAVENIESIAATQGVDALYIGPADLGLALCGMPALDVNEVFDGNHPCANQLSEAFASVVTACERNGLIPGLHVGDGATARRVRGTGFRLSSVTADTGLIASGLARELDSARAR